MNKKSGEEWEIAEISIREIRSIIPAHCFERNTFRSFAYLFKDLFYVGALVYCASSIGNISFAPLRLVLWPVYWFLQSAVCTGLWMICHECGHQAFSSSKVLCDGVGMVVHSFMLVPYYSWAITHGKHHNTIGHVTRDKANICHKDQYHNHIPKLRSSTGLPPLAEDPEIDGPHSILEHAPFVELLRLSFFLFVAWPYYMLFHTPGDTTRERWVSHFNPNCFIFDKSQYWQVVQSIIGVLIMLGVLIGLGSIYGLINIIKFYIIPHILTHAWMITITYIQHTAPELPHYDSEVWSYQRGVALTVDRSYGAFLDHVFHHIGDTHFLHHVVHTIPHYHTVEATEHLKKALGKHYRRDDTPIYKVLFNSWTKCKFVENEGAVRFYKN
ncbi:hypothetical protein PHYBLDRAFT_155437 [Phycomyces blakesleeanus NRRL 1555(-)]|uniref:Fatty acid desaturase domain-containing protein n=1 Tax=Phycomyces blakesleeanus (strain ATCC 8743b / DSM 1359 / FGSC 10004 / NBRC 33097 / NRRL 1555) TaxID=763407 RepID=A0A167MN22_PHYB8|nr:hypothetical protein PHYBLDRAFT_155437 [Phycomyces blakesleeanus NRRL 1555(-)]OAD73329.1 hypothetical protein PHYBLDRAFT_155437 [Phycomyces blakesleeanus NRRL 1555(-)]|eukprot:XP_018291369.1 hypothetical protein PHYBLDRAFT_155437 [Phycomyces blakesleeanus NRRL 1555(-)]